MNVSIFHNMISFVFNLLLRKSRSEASEKVFQLCERAFRSRLTLREEGQVELLGRRLTDLARVQSCALRTDSVKTIFLRIADSISKNAVSFSFRTHNETLSVVAMSVNNPDRWPVGINH
jgi:hypothetical protein